MVPIRARNGTDALCFGWLSEGMRCRHTTVGAQIQKKTMAVRIPGCGERVCGSRARPRYVPRSKRNGTDALCFGWLSERMRCRHTTVGAQIQKKTMAVCIPGCGERVCGSRAHHRATCRALNVSTCSSTNAHPGMWSGFAGPAARAILAFSKYRLALRGLN